MEDQLEAEDIDVNLAIEQYRILSHKGFYTEIRAIKNSHVKQIFVENEAELMDKIRVLILGGYDIYVGINPRKTEGGDFDSVATISAVVFDFDPVRSTGTPSTDAQLEQSIRMATEVSKQFSSSIIVSSGSGAHLYVALQPVEATRQREERLKVWAKGIADKYSTNEVKIDHTFDLPRVIRAWGTFNHKSKRYCYPVDTLNGPFTAISLYPFDELIPQLTKVTREVTTLKSTDSIPNGFRNNVLTSLAGTMRRKGFGFDAIFAALMEENLQKCNPPLTESEVKVIAGSVSRYEPTQAVTNTVKTITDSYFKDLESRKPGIMTGFYTLDQMLSGLKGGRLYVAAARPTDGKTTFLAQMGKNLALSGFKTLIFPTEVGASSIFDKLVSSESEVNLRKFQWGNFTEEEKKKIQDSKEKLSKIPLVVAEDFSLTIEKIERTIKEVMPEIVIVDFLQSMYFDEGGSPKEYAKAVIALKSFAGKYNIPIIMASQLSRASEGNPLSLGHLKGSGVIEEQGDTILYLSTLDRLVYPRPVLLTVMKNKYGEAGHIKMEFFSSVCKFIEK